MQVKMRSELERIFLVRHAFMPVIISACQNIFDFIVGISAQEYGYKEAWFKIAF